MLLFPLQGCFIYRVGESAAAIPPRAIHGLQQQQGSSSSGSSSRSTSSSEVGECIGECSARQQVQRHRVRRQRRHGSSSGSVGRLSDQFWCGFCSPSRRCGCFRCCSRRLLPRSLLTAGEGKGGGAAAGAATAAGGRAANAPARQQVQRHRDRRQRRHGSSAGSVSRACDQFWCGFCFPAAVAASAAAPAAFFRARC